MRFMFVLLLFASGTNDIHAIFFNMKTPWAGKCQNKLVQIANGQVNRIVVLFSMAWTAGLLSYVCLRDHLSLCRHWLALPHLEAADPVLSPSPLSTE